MDRVFELDGVVDAHAMRARALSAPFADIPAIDGHTYKRVARVYEPEIIEGLRAITGAPFLSAGQAVRLNYDGELPENVVHVDTLFGSWACLTFLSRPEDCRGGTAFYRHRATGMTRIEPGRDLHEDWHDPNAWDIDYVAPMVFGRCVLYPAGLFHSRWPHEAWGSTPEDGRLYIVSFLQLGMG